MNHGNGKDDFEMHRDPISGEPGAHPIGTGLGAAGGAAAGAAAGAAVGIPGGPVGIAVAGAIGAVIGGLGGSAASEALNPTGEEQFWRAHFENELRPAAGRGYDDYAPAYRFGYENRERMVSDSFEQVEPDLSTEWHQTGRGSGMAWQDARPAVRAAWNHVEH